MTTTPPGSSPADGYACPRSVPHYPDDSVMQWIPQIISLVLTVVYVPWKLSGNPFPTPVLILCLLLSCLSPLGWVLLNKPRISKSTFANLLTETWPLFLGLMWIREVCQARQVTNLLLLVGFTLTFCLWAARHLQQHVAKLDNPDRSWPRTVSWVLAAAFTVVFAIEPWMKYHFFRTYWMDFGYMIHPIWNTAQGRLLEYAYIDGSFSSSLGDHFSPIFILIAVIFKPLPFASTLFIIQAAAGAMGGIIVFRMAEKSFGTPLQALLFQASYYLYAPLQYAMITDFHADPLAVPFFFMMIAGFQSKRFRWILTGFILSLATKEYIGLLMAPLLFVFAYRHKPWRWQLAVMAVAGIVYSILSWTCFIPLFNRGEETLSLAVMYPGGHDGLAGVVSTMITKPVQTLTRILSVANLEGMIWLLLPLLFVPALVVPEILSLFSILFKEVYGTFAMHNHHQALMTPMLFWCVLLFAARMQPNPRRSLLLGVCLSCLLIGFVSGESPLSHRFWRAGPAWYFPNAHNATLREAVKLVPAGASVSADSHIAVHLYNRRHLYLFPHPLPEDSVDYVLLDRKHNELGIEIKYITWKGYRREDLLAMLDSLDRSGSYTKIFDNDGVVVLRKSTAAQTQTP